METALFILVGVIAIINLVEVKILSVKLDFYKELISKPEAPAMSREEFEEFKQADEEATERFANLLSGLNDFMTK